MKQLSENIIQPLTEWFRKNRRELPWRADRDPYHVWISEIMLQQTRIEAVKKYYIRFITALPDIRSLSEVDDDTLLKLWEGLGYYSRARNLKKAALMITSDFGGVFPNTFKEIRSLPGIGDYTAGAIASICFHERVTAVDGNVMRVVSRLIQSGENILLPETKRLISERICRILPEDAGVFNEALMELGETVCLPNTAPLCESCPLKDFCEAYRHHLTDRLPVRIKTAKRKQVEKTVFLIRSSDSRIAIEKRPDEGLLSKMYQLPNIDGYYSEKELKSILTDWKLRPAEVHYLKDKKHIFTHIEWHMRAYTVTTETAPERFLWVTEEELKDAYPLPVAFQKFI